MQRRLTCRRFTRRRMRGLQMLRSHSADPECFAAERRALYADGVRFAPLFYAFVRFVIDSVERLGLDRVYYLTREGEFFRAIHQQIAAGRPAPLPRAELLEVS